MQIKNLDLNTAAGHRVLYAMDNMRARVTQINGRTVEGILAVHAVRHPHVTVNLDADAWKPVRIPRKEVISIEYIPEP